MVFKISCGAEILLDDEDYNLIPKTGWYLQKKEKHNPKTDYAVHDDCGFMHRYLLMKHGYNIEGKLIDHINRNGLDNRKSNLRIVDCSTNKKNQSIIKSNSLHFNGLALEYTKKNDYFRIRVSWSEEKYVQSTKSFPFKNFSSPQECLREAVLFRISKMKEFGYTLDERSTTIEKELANPNTDIEKLLNINLKQLILNKIGSSESKWRASSIG